MTNDLTSLFQTSDDPQPVRLWQGVIQEWDGDTADNQIAVGGGVLENVPVLIAASTGLAAGDVVALLSMGDRWFLLGKVTTPGDPGTVPSYLADVEALMPLVEVAAVTNGLEMTGATQSTGATGARVVLNDPAYPGQIALFSGNAGEERPALIRPILGGANYGVLSLRSPELVDPSSGYAFLDLEGYDDGHTNLIGEADNVRFEGDTMVLRGFTSVAIGDGTDHLQIAGQAVTDADLSDLSNTFPTFPHYYGYLNANQSIASGGAGATITGWVDDGAPNSSGIADPAAGVFTVPTAGRYRLSVQGWWSLIAGPAGARTIQWVQVAPNIVLASHTMPPSALAATPTRAEKTVRLAAGAQIFARVSQSQGAAVNLVGSNPDLTYVQIEWVGP